MRNSEWQGARNFLGGLKKDTEKEHGLLRGPRKARMGRLHPISRLIRRPESEHGRTYLSEPTSSTTSGGSLKAVASGARQDREYEKGVSESRCGVPTLSF